MPIVGVPTGSSASSPVSTLIMSIRDKIPDPVSDPTQDGTDFSLSSLLRWINKSASDVAAGLPAIEDWYAIPSEKGQHVYNVPNIITGIHQAWYDNWPMWRSAELDELFVNKIQSRSYFFGPHSMHYQPRFSFWPASDRSGQTTTLSSAIGATDVTIPLTAVTNFLSFGYCFLESELILYRTVNASPTNTLTQVLRGQGGTTAVAHAQGSIVTEGNIYFKCTRLPTALATINDILEIPLALHDLIELGVMADIRESEQEYGEARELRKEFHAAVKELVSLGAQKGLRQGMQVRTNSPGPLFYYGRLYVP